MFLHLLSLRPALGAVLLLASALGPAAPAQANGQAGGQAGGASDEPGALMAQAFDYAYPLVAMGRLRAASLGAGTDASPSPAWQHRRELADPARREVTTPNVDTLYSLLWLDLRQGPVELSLPDMAGRYHSLAFIDMVGNNFAMLGRRLNGTRSSRHVLVGPDWPGPMPKAARVIRAPSNDVLVLARILVDGPQDLPAVHALQDQLVAQPLAAAPRPPVWDAAPPLGPTPQAFVDLANRMLERNPPPAYEQALLGRLAAVGLCGAACAWDRLSPALQAQWTQSLPTLLAGLKTAAFSAGRTVNGWRYGQANLGQFGTDYRYRASTALSGLLALEPVESVYPSTGVDAQGLALSGAHRYRLRLPAGGLPVNAFWSLSMYEVEPDGRLFFSANALRRYAIGDRTPGLQVAADGAVDLTIQHEAPATPEQARNWLPAPQGAFRLVLRAYEPRAALLDGQITLPAVERLD
ncbi:MAG: DUF1254 domain-containing protein [Curvibacter lanceolatus]|uniref:DUF1254 domain-containing protein n=1 Tax=Curvibacter lanceolatus TaxID=86182 RepID=UPI002352242C|nr:DUF1254 domain-containing protein [Curvibacter lanceolatus]MBV5294842.1 DUF1254 domain-containing protein [Curvibacter lanceolatus]